ncbi:Rad9-domain-containing protein [Cercophora scortea]|uniref:DNA repair protein rad9 n=1 Tax=Cercophora scortea TaxID=314031 RepID=A0AAE0MIE4_9PEZI|nr:Rad9-domain-containing protein [Cercophora scortea]
MAVLNFTLSEEGATVFHDALACMFKFSDDVCMEARQDKLTLTALNISKSAYICFTFAANRFFSRYVFEGNAQYRDRFFCQLTIRALLSIFRTRQGGELPQSKDSSIDKCDVVIDDGPGKKSRLIARVICRNGITASHSLAFEVKPPTHAKFIKDEAQNRWTISSRTLRQLMDHFGPGIELLDINTDNDASLVNFTCFTETMQQRRGGEDDALRKPLHTNIAVEMDEFDVITVKDKLHIIISVKDFRAILQHAQITGGELTTFYSDPGRPMKLSYGGDGVLCEFILMTVGEKDASALKHKNPRQNAAKSAKQPLDAASHRASSVPQAAPPKPNPTQQKLAPRPRQSQFEIRPQPMPPPPPPAPPATADSDSLFVPQADEDDQWEPLNDDDDEEVDQIDRLQWNSTGEPVMIKSSHFHT